VSTRIFAIAAFALAAVACGGDGDSSPTPTPTERIATPTDRPATETPLGTADDIPRRGTWRTLAPMPTPRSEVAVAAVGGKIYVVGGFEGDGSTSDTVEVYDPATDTWTQAPPLPEGRHHAAAIGVADIFLFVIGGFGGGFNDPQANVYRLDTTRSVWEERAPLSMARGGHALAASACPSLTGACIYAVGGSDAGQGNVPQVEVYDDVTDIWTTVASLPTPRDHLAAAPDFRGGRIYAIGGRANVDFGRNLDANEEYNPATDTWTAKAPLPTARSGIAAASTLGRIYVFGGEGSEGTFAENEAYDTATDTWETLDPMPTARHGLGAVAFGDTIYVIGGGETPGGSVSAHNEAFTP
jgi:N-acetylneuraminic acid mutarotase